MADSDILVSELPSASQVNTNDLVMLTQPDDQSDTGYTTKKGTTLEVFNKALNGTQFSTDLPSFTDKTVLGGMEELKGDISSLYPVDTAGPASIASFDTDLAVNLVDVKTTLTPSLTGYTTVNLTRCGVNLWGGETMADSFASAADYSKDTNTKTFTFSADKIAPYDETLIKGCFKENTQYTIILRYTAVATNNSIRVLYSDGTRTALNLSATNDKTDFVLTTTLGKTISAIILTYYSDGLTTVYYDESGLFEGVKTVADFTPYTGNAYAIALGDTYYGGTLDVTTGVLTVEYDSSLQPITPYDVQLTPVQIAAIVGQNNVFSDTGDTTVKYKEGIQHYIDKKIAQTQALIL